MMQRLKIVLRQFSQSPKWMLVLWILGTQLAMIVCEVQSLRVRLHAVFLLLGDEYRRLSH